MRVGFVGLGRMGVGMASNLLKAGHDVTVFNRSASRAAPLVAQGAVHARDVSSACLGNVVITMLADDAAVEAVVLGQGGIAESLGRGALHISSSTISVELATRLTERHASAGQQFVAAPVFGRPEAAAAAQLFVLAAGESAALAVAIPLLNAIGQRTFVVSETPRAANLVKLSGNFLIATVIEALGEAFALVGKGGIDRHLYLEILTSTLFNAPLYMTYGALIVNERFQPAGFAAPLGQKDIRLVLAAAEALHVALPFASILRDRLLTLLAQGGEDLDWAAIGSLAARDAGVNS